MNQSELIEKVAQATELNQAAAGQAVKAVANAILDALLAGEAVRVSGFGIFNVAARPARQGRNRNRSQQGSAVPCRQGRQRCPQSANSEEGSPEEDRTTKEIRGAEVNFHSMLFGAHSLGLPPLRRPGAPTIDLTQRNLGPTGLANDQSRAKAR